MAKVLVTGASGFIGSHLVETLIARGDEVTALVRRTSPADPLRSLGATLAHGDVTQAEGLREAVVGQSVVYHVAGSTRALRARELFEVNRRGVGNVARACAEQARPPVLVVVSSLAAAGPSPRGRLRTDADPLHPVSAYGRSKRAGEKAARQFADRVPITIVRPPIVLGERDRNGLAMFKAVARTGLHLVPGSAPETYSIIHAADLAQLLVLAAERGTRLAPAGACDPSDARGFYFAAGDQHPTWCQLGRMIGAALGRGRAFTLPVPMALAWTLAAGTEVVAQISRQPFYLGIDKFREVSAGSWACSPQKALEELGFSVAAPLAERLRQTVEWYRKTGWL